MQPAPRDRVTTAGERGIYVSIMLFDVYCFITQNLRPPDGKPILPRDGMWIGNVFHENNNINAVNIGDDFNAEEFFSLRKPAIVERQKAYIRRATAAVAAADNVIWEIANEQPSGPEAALWMAEMVKWVRECEVRSKVQHPILVSPGGIVPGTWSPERKKFRWGQTTLKELLSTGPDFYAAGIATAKFKKNDLGNPPAADTVCAILPGVVDRDHADPGAPNNKSETIPWAMLTRGYAGYSLYEQEWGKENHPDASQWDNARYNIGALRRYADIANLAEMHPRNDMADTRFCLTKPGDEYIILAMEDTAFKVHGLVPGAEYAFEWFLTRTHAVAGRGSVVAAEPSYEWDPPEAKVVLYVKRLHPQRGAAPAHVTP